MQKEKQSREDVTYFSWSEQTDQLSGSKAPKVFYAATPTRVTDKGKFAVSRIDN